MTKVFNKRRFNLKNIKTYTDSVATINKSLLGWIKMSLKDKGDIFELAHLLGINDGEDYTENNGLKATLDLDLNKLLFGTIKVLRPRYYVL